MTRFEIVLFFIENATSRRHPRILMQWSLVWGFIIYFGVYNMVDDVHQCSPSRFALIIQWTHLNEDTHKDVTKFLIWKEVKKTKNN